jgi:hypothetical protein
MDMAEDKAQEEYHVLHFARVVSGSGECGEGSAQKVDDCAPHVLSVRFGSKLNSPRLRLTVSPLATGSMSSLRPRPAPS